MLGPVVGALLGFGVATLAGSNRGSSPGGLVWGVVVGGSLTALGVMAYDARELAHTRSWR